MGLFDTIRCECPLPDPEDQERSYQTKDLDRGLLTYTITQDGRLIRHAAPRGKLTEDVEWPIHGDIRMYDSDRETKRWTEYVVRFTNGRVEWIQRLEDVEPHRESGTALPLPYEGWLGPPGSHRSEQEAQDEPSSDDAAAEEALLRNLRQSASDLEALVDESDSHWGYEDPVYRFYHQSFKVYGLQEQTRKIVTVLEQLVPGRPLNRWFSEIVEQGTGIEFTAEHNRRWTHVTRPIVEAFFHARYFLEMAARYSDVEEPPRFLPSGYAALLTLYGLR